MTGMLDSAQASFLTDQSCRLWLFEFPATCAVLAAIPQDKRDYRPDGLSRTAWHIATHLATSDLWMLESIINGEFDWNPEVQRERERQFSTIHEVVSHYQHAWPAALDTLRALPGSSLASPVSFFGMMDWPRASYVAFAANHSIHHRGQLSAYLRAMGSKVPVIYGSSADFPGGS